MPKEHESPRDYINFLDRLKEDQEKHQKNQQFGILIYEAANKKGVQLKDFRKYAGISSARAFYALMAREVKNAHTVLKQIRDIARFLELDRVQLTALYFIDVADEEQAAVLQLGRVYARLPPVGRRLLEASSDSLEEVYLNEK